MDTLASLSVRAFIESFPFCEEDIPMMRQQYYELCSCHQGLQVSLQCAEYMSDQVCRLLDLFQVQLKSILQRFHSFRAQDVRQCVLFLDLECSRLFRLLNSEFNGFHVPHLHSVLQDFEDGGYEYLGFRFSPKYDPRLSPHDFVKVVSCFPPMSSIGLCELLLGKTSQIVTACNEVCYERQVYSGLYIDSLDSYFTARSDLRGISRSVSLDCTVRAYKLNLVSKLNSVLQILRYEI